MTVTVRPSRAKGVIEAPPSKSMAHRLLIAAGLSDGVSVVDRLSPSEDLLATLDCLRALGADCRYDGSSATVRGIGGEFRQKAPHLPCRECGSTLRFFIPIAAISEEITTFSGSPRLFSRPLTVYEELFSEKGLPFHLDESRLTLAGRLTGGEFTVKGNISSQFISGLLFALPLCQEDSVIRLIPPIESRPYIDLTLSALKAFGISADWTDDTTISVKGGNRYRAAKVTVEGDWSNAAFFEALSALGDRLSLTGLDDDSLQGDRIARAYFYEMKRGTPTLSIADCPDLAPILMTFAALNHGACFTDTARLAIKESDRGRVMAKELQKCGITCTVEKNRITVHKGCPTPPKEALSGHNDHRIVMALSVLLTRLGGTITGAEAVAKSYPDFFEKLTALSIDCTVSEDI